MGKGSLLISVFPHKSSNYSRGERQVLIAILPQGPWTMLWSNPLLKHAFISYFMYFTNFPAFGKFNRLSKSYWLPLTFIYDYIKPIFILVILLSCLCHYHTNNNVVFDY